MSKKKIIALVVTLAILIPVLIIIPDVAISATSVDADDFEVSSDYSADDIKVYADAATLQDEFTFTILNKTNTPQTVDDFTFTYVIKDGSISVPVQYAMNITLDSPKLGYIPKQAVASFQLHDGETAIGNKSKATFDLGTVSTRKVTDFFDITLTSQQLTVTLTSVDVTAKTAIVTVGIAKSLSVKGSANPKMLGITISFVDIPFEQAIDVTHSVPITVSLATIF